MNAKAAGESPAEEPENRADPLHEYRSEGLAAERLNSFLHQQARQGLTQQQVAAAAAIPAQYLSNIKHGHRMMTELVARRLGEAFRINHEWLLGLSDSVEPLRAEGAPPRTWLPLFPHPIFGPPREHPKWDGIGIEIGSAASGKVALAERPYVLKFGAQDIHHRLRRGDLLLMSQAPSDSAELNVIEYRRQHYLARDGDKHWERIANGDELPKTAPVRGHAMAVIYSSLLREGT